MTLTVTIPEELYRRVVEIAGRHQVSPERLASAAVAEQITQWSRIETLAAQADRDQFLAAMDKVPGTEPAIEDRL